MDDGLYSSVRGVPYRFYYVSGKPCRKVQGVEKMNVVHKYGGTSVATVEKIKAVATRVAEVKRAGNQIAVVASAMGSTTDELIKLARQMGDQLNPREMDSLLSTGEQRTVTLLAMALENLGIPAVSLTGFQCGFVTDSHHSKAKIWRIDSERLEQVIREGNVPVITGFQGITEDGDITTLGRGGSDTTAVAVAAKLGWDCEIYTDVDGVYTVDPRKCPGAKKLAQISYDEMMEMSSLGSGVLETRSVELAKKYQVKLFLGRSLEKDLTRGTYIVNTNAFEEMSVTGISVIDDCTMLSTRCEAIGENGVSGLFSMIAELNVNVDMISQQTLDQGNCMVSFSCSSESAQRLEEEVEKKGLPYVFTSQPSLVKVSLVGAGMITHSGVAAKAFSILSEAKIRYYQITTSEISISITIDNENKQRAVETLAHAFDLCEK